MGAAGTGPYIGEHKSLVRALLQKQRLVGIKKKNTSHITIRTARDVEPTAMNP